MVSFSEQVDIDSPFRSHLPSAPLPMAGGDIVLQFVWPSTDSHADMRTVQIKQLDEHGQPQDVYKASITSLTFTHHNTDQKPAPPAKVFPSANRRVGFGRDLLSADELCYQTIRGGRAHRVVIQSQRQCVFWTRTGNVPFAFCRIDTESCIFTRLTRLTMEIKVPLRELRRTKKTTSKSV